MSSPDLKLSLFPVKTTGSSSPNLPPFQYPTTSLRQGYGGHARNIQYPSTYRLLIDYHPLSGLAMG